MPGNLTPAAQEVWKRTVTRLIETGTVAELHTDCLRLYCEVFARIEADPDAAKPALITLALKLQGELGITPATYARAPVLKEPPATDPPWRVQPKQYPNIRDLLRSSEAGQPADKSSGDNSPPSPEKP